MANNTENTSNNWLYSIPFVGSSLASLAGTNNSSNINAARNAFQTNAYAAGPATPYNPSGQVATYVPPSTTPTSTGPGGAYPIAGGYQAPTQQSYSAPSGDPTSGAQSSAEQAAQDAYNAQNQQLNTQFDYTKAQLEGQLGTLENQRDQSLGQVDLGMQDVQNQVGTNKTNLATSTQQQINQAGSTARNVQGQNRNVLRSLGILNSSAAGQILAKPGNQFDEQRAQLGQFLVQKTTELDQFVAQKVAEASQVKNSILQNYNDLVGKIQTDLRFNDRQRNDALQQANAALSQHLSDISTSVMNYKQQADLQKQQIQASLGTVLNYTPQQADLGSINNLGLTNQSTAQSANIYQDPNLLKKQNLGGY